jgi:hypothetical protein
MDEKWILWMKTVTTMRLPITVDEKKNYDVSKPNCWMN